MVVTVRVNMNSTDLRRLGRKLSPVERGRRLRNGMTESLQYLQGQVQLQMPVDSGRGRSSVIPSPVTGQLPANLRGTVGSSEVHVVVMELGRRPGSRMPPPGPILLWMKRHGMPEDIDIAWRISRAIGRRGIRGWPKHMFRNAARRGRGIVQSIVARHMRGPV